MTKYIQKLNEICNESKYSRSYIKLMIKAAQRVSRFTSISKQRKAAKELFEYVESHHLVPESFFKNKSKTGIIVDLKPNHIENMIHLTAKEHFVAHHLLTRMFENPVLKYKMYGGYMKMCQDGPTQSRRITARQFQRGRRLVGESTKARLSGTHQTRTHIENMKKSRWTDEKKTTHGNLIREMIKSGKIPVPGNGYQQTPEHKEKLRVILQKPKSKITKERMSKARKLYWMQKKSGSLELVKNNDTKP